MPNFFIYSQCDFPGALLGVPPGLPVVILLKMCCSELKIVSQLGAHKTRVHDDFFCLKNRFFCWFRQWPFLSISLMKRVYIELTHSDLFLKNSFKVRPFLSLKLKSIKFIKRHTFKNPEKQNFLCTLMEFHLVRTNVSSWPFEMFLCLGEDGEGDGSDKTKLAMCSKCLK